MSETETKVCKLIADELGYEDDEVTPSSTFEQLEADSLDLAEIVILIEEEFNVTIGRRCAELQVRCRRRSLRGQPDRELIMEDESTRLWAAAILGFVLGLITLISRALIRKLIWRPVGTGLGNRLYFSRVEGEDFSFEGVIERMNITAGRRVKVTARFSDKFGNTGAPIQPGTARWESDDPTKVAVEALPEAPGDGGKVTEVSAYVTSLGPAGAAAINLTADGDLGDGITEIKASGAVNVLPGGATQVAPLEFGSEEDVPAAVETPPASETETPPVETGTEGTGTETATGGTEGG